MIGGGSSCPHCYWYFFCLHLISVVRSSYFGIFSAFLITFLSPEIVTSIYIHVPFFAITDYDAQLIVRNGAASSHLLNQHIVNLPSTMSSKKYILSWHKIFNSLLSSVTIFKIDKAKFKAALRKYLHTHSFYPVDDFFFCV